MQDTSTLYKQLLSDINHWFEISLVIGEDGRLVDEYANTITFGGTAILVSTGGGDSGYQETQLRSIVTTVNLFSGNTPSVGNAVAGEIDVVMVNPTADIPRMAMLVPYVRVTNGIQHSEWIKKGVYYIDTREVTNSGDGINLLTLHGYDSMLKADQDYATTHLTWNAKDTDVVREIASAMGVSVDSRTFSVMNKSYRLAFPAGYTMRETLAYISAMYAGSFVMTDAGQLRLVTLWELPRETNILVDHAGFSLTFGGDHILV